MTDRKTAIRKRERALRDVDLGEQFHASPGDTPYSLYDIYTTENIPHDMERVWVGQLTRLAVEAWREAILSARSTPAPSEGEVGGLIERLYIESDFLGRPAELMKLCAEAADALTRLQAERDEALREHTDMLWQRRRADERAEAAEARVRELEEALEAERVKSVEMRARRALGDPRKGVSFSAARALASKENSDDPR